MSREELPAPTAWVGWVFFAAAVMVLLGVFHIITGLVALLKDEYFSVRPSGLIVSVDYTTWGWTHLLMGVLLIIAGYALIAGQTWARILTVVLAMVSAVVNLGFLAAAPLWSTIVIALDIVVIYAVTVHGSEVRRDWRGPAN